MFIIEASSITSCSSLSDADTYQFSITPAEKQDFVEEVNTELSVYFGMLYFLVEMFKGDDQFGEELSAYRILYHAASVLTLFSELGAASSGLPLQPGLIPER